jgi:hypothetical protein
MVLSSSSSSLSSSLACRDVDDTIRSCLKKCKAKVDKSYKVCVLKTGDPVCETIRRSFKDDCVRTCS